jgi:membrane fusion protein (multidrug efflux system)
MLKISAYRAWHMEMNTLMSKTKENELQNHSDAAGADQDKNPKKRTLITLLLVAVIAIAVSLVYFWHRSGFEATDDAFIDGAIIQISPRVSGQVVRVPITDNQHVDKGDLLVELDPRDYETAVTKARAALSKAEARNSGAKAGLDLTMTVTDAALIQTSAGLKASQAQVDVLRAGVRQAEASANAAEASLQQAEANRAAIEAEARRAGADAERYRALYKKDEVSKQLMDQAETAARTTAANLDAAKQTVVAARAQLAQAKAGQASAKASLRQAETLVRQAEGRLKEAEARPEQIRVRHADLEGAVSEIEESRAALQQAELNLSYTKIYAPESGYVTKKSVEPGNIVGAGQNLMALVTDRLWVTANFKEVQLEYMRPGQSVTIKIDAYPQRKFNGEVNSIQAGSGARFSLLPPENATGNYVKVVQRVPVKILFTEELPSEFKIGPGMSVVPEVKVR